MFFDKEWEMVSITDVWKDKDIIIFGCSMRNEELFRYIPKDRIKCIYDNDEAKWGTIVNGIKVQQPQKKVNEILVTAVMDYKNLIPQFELLGFDTFYCYMCDEIYQKYYKEYIPFYLRNAWQYEFADSVQNCKYLHVISDDKFFSPTVEMIENAFDIKEHAFIIYYFNIPNLNNRYGMWDKYLELSKKSGNVVIVDDSCNFRGIDNQEVLRNALIKMQNVEKIIFHGEWMTPTIKDFFAQEEILDLVKEKGIWIVWSGNVGKDKANEANIEQVLKYCKVCALLREREFEQLSKCVKLEAKRHFDNRLNYTRILERPMARSGNRNVLLGHSCFSYNNVVDSLKILEKFKGEIDVYAITSYGDEEYIDEVIALGNKIYGEHFHAINNYMSYPEYVEFLNSMDVAVWGENVAAGNTTLQILFWLEKKVYLKEESYKLQVDNGYQPCMFSQIEEEELNEFWNNKYRKKNYEVAKEVFNKEKLIQKWRELFELDMDYSE